MRIFSNLALSLDGRIAQFDRPATPLGTPFDRKIMQDIRYQADAILVGASTMGVTGEAITAKTPNKSRHYPANVILTGAGNIKKSWPVWSEGRCVKFVFTTQSSYGSVQKKVRDRAFVEIAGKNDINLNSVIERLARSGIKNLLVEGGGKTLGAFIEANLLDEIYCTLCPWILGGGKNPSFVNISEIIPWKKLEIIDSKRVKNEIYLHYKVKKPKKSRKRRTP